MIRGTDVTAVYRDGEYQGVDVPDCRGRACLPCDQIPKITNEIPPSYFCFRNSVVKTPSTSILEFDRVYAYLP